MDYSFPGPFLLSYSVFSFPLFSVSVPCATLSWPSRQLLSARKYTVSYRYCFNTQRKIKIDRFMILILLQLTIFSIYRILLQQFQIVGF